MTKTKEQLEEEKKIALSIRLKPLQPDAEGNLLLFFELLLGLCHFSTGIPTSTTGNRLLLISTSSCLLGFKHFFSLCFSFFKLFLLFFGFLSFLLILFLSEFFFLFFLLLVELLFLFSSNFFPLCLLFLQLLELLLFLL